MTRNELEYHQIAFENYGYCPREFKILVFKLADIDFFYIEQYVRSFVYIKIYANRENGFKCCNFHSCILRKTPVQNKKEFSQQINIVTFL